MFVPPVPVPVPVPVEVPAVGRLVVAAALADGWARFVPDGPAMAWLLGYTGSLLTFVLPLV